MTTTAAIQSAGLPAQRHDAELPHKANDGNSFASVLEARAGRVDNRRAQTREAATQLVASTFIVPVLGQLRETSWAAGPFAPSTAEKRFGPMLDQQLADRIIEASNFDIVDAIAERYAGHDVRRAGLERTG